MSAWAKLAISTAVIVVPGGFLLLFAYAAYRLMRLGWQEAKASGGEVHVKDVFSHVHLRDLVREARIAL